MAEKLELENYTVLAPDLKINAKVVTAGERVIMEPHQAKHYLKQGWICRLGEEEKVKEEQRLAHLAKEAARKKAEAERLAKEAELVEEQLKHSRRVPDEVRKVKDKADKAAQAAGEAESKLKGKTTKKGS